MTIQRIQWRRGTAAEWTSANPTLASGEGGFETDTGKFKIGDGSTAWASLGYYGLLSQATSADGAYRILADRAGRHAANIAAGTYPLAAGSTGSVVSGSSTTESQGIFYFAPADYPAVGALTAKLRVRGEVHCNDVAPTGDWTFGMYPVTRPATSGSAGSIIYTLGTVVTGSATGTVSAPAADSSNAVVGSDFAMPAAGFYALGLVKTGTTAASSFTHVFARLQLHYSA